MVRKFFSRALRCLSRNVIRGTREMHTHGNAANYVLIPVRQFSMATTAGLRDTEAAITSTDYSLRRRRLNPIYAALRIENASPIHLFYFTQRIQ